MGRRLGGGRGLGVYDTEPCSREATEELHPGRAREGDEEVCVAPLSLGN